MPKIYIRAVKGKTLIDKFISFKTASPYTHVEFAYPFYRPVDVYTRWLGAQPKGGIQIRPKNYLGKVEFDVFSVDCGEYELSQIERNCFNAIGTPYSITDIIDDALNLMYRSTRRAYDCSEFVTLELAKVGIHLFNTSVSNRYYSRITPRDVCLSPRLKLA